MRQIDADALKRRLEGWPSEFFDYDELVPLIDEQPTLSPDEVRGVGKWIWHDNLGWDDSLECSCCAEEFVLYDGKFHGIDSFKFCPNCGAKMEGTSDGI